MPSALICLSFTPTPPQAANEGSIRGEFDAWESHYGKVGRGNYKQWKEGLKKIAAINAQNRGWWAAPNKHMDLTWWVLRVGGRGGRAGSCLQVPDSAR